MILDKKNYKKTQTTGVTKHIYTCNDIEFILMEILTEGNILFKISMIKDDASYGDVFETYESLEAWNHFEQLIEKECGEEQGSSGGFKKDPNQMPPIPLIAMKREGDFWIGVLFFMFPDKTQIPIFPFRVTADAMPTPIPNTVFTVDWRDEDVTMILKSEALMKATQDIKFEADSDMEVFFFIPKSIIGQDPNPVQPQYVTEPPEGGGEPPQGGGEPPEGGTEPPEGVDEPPQGGGEPPQGGGEPPEGGTEPPQGGGEPPQGGGEPPQGTNEPPQGTNEPPQDGGQPTDRDDERKTNGDLRDEAVGGKTQSGLQSISGEFDTIIDNIADVTGVAQDSLIAIFRNEDSTANFLIGQDFKEIKTALGADPKTTPRQLAKQIIEIKNR